MTASRRRISVFVVVMMVLALTPMLCAIAYAEEAVDSSGAADSQNAVEGGLLADSYREVGFSDLVGSGQLTLSDAMTATTLADSPENGGVFVKGPVSELAGGAILVSPKFDFDGNRVGRITIGGASEQGVVVKALVFLDGGTEPVAVIPLDAKSKKETWGDASSDVTAYAYDRNITGRHSVSIGFEVIGKDADEITKVLLQSIEFAEDPGIPTVYINVDESNVTVEEMNSSVDHSVRCTGSLDIRVPEGFCSEYQSADDAMQSQVGLELDYIRGRGNSTWSAEIAKKPYRFKLAKKADLFGMGKNAHYVLLANRFDNSLVRNRMTYWLTGANGMNMEFSPQCVPVDVVLNGEYYGSYLLAENIRIDKNRVDIDSLEEQDTELPEISGGYLLAMNPDDDEDFRSVFTTERGLRFVNDSPDFVDYENEAQKQYIRSYLQMTEDAIFGDGFKTQDGVGYAEYMDLDSAVDYWWLQELSTNGDAYATDSTYLYKKRDGKLFWGPPWDFDYVAWGDLQEPGYFRIESFDNTHTPWFDRLFDDPIFVQKLKERWSGIDQLVTEIVREEGLLDLYYEQTRISQRYDNAKHGYYSESYGEDDEIEIEAEAGEGEEGEAAEEAEDVEGSALESAYEGEIEQLRTWVAQRQEWINEHLNELEHQIQNVDFVVDGKVVKSVRVRWRVDSGIAPEDPQKPGYVFAGWYTEPEDGEELLYVDRVEEDTTFYAQFVDEADATVADTIYFRDEKTWVSVHESWGFLEYSLLPEDASIQRISWKSSDPSIAEIGYRGSITPHKTGTVTVTATLPKGETASCVLTVYDPVETPQVSVEEIMAQNETVKVEAGAYVQNRIIIKPDDAPVELNYLEAESDDPDVAYADANGVVYGVSPGTATITVSVPDSYVSCTFDVTVTGGQGQEDDYDAAAEAIEMLEQLNGLVDPKDYTASSYADFKLAYDSAMEQLQNDFLDPEEINALLHSVIMVKLEKKSANTLKLKAKTATVKYSKLKKKNKKLAASKVIQFASMGQGKLAYKMASAKKGKKSFKSYFSINEKTGKVTVKKGLTKGAYKVKVTVKAAGDGNHKPSAVKRVTFTVKVK